MDTATVQKEANSKRGFPSFSGRHIYNAETGVPTEHYVGTSDEHLYWKVSGASHRGEMGDSNVFFYDSPEQYLRHRFRAMKYFRPNENIRRWENRREMVKDSDSMILWSLVTKTGEKADDFIDSKKSGIMMVPRVNPVYVTRWHAKRSEYLSSLTGTRSMDVNENLNNNSE